MYEEGKGMWAAVCETPRLNGGAFGEGIDYTVGSE